MQIIDTTHPAGRDLVRVLRNAAKVSFLAKREARSGFIRLPCSSGLRKSWAREQRLDSRQASSLEVAGCVEVVR